MPAVLPWVNFDKFAASYPCTRSISFSTTVSQSENSSEQRISTRGALTSFNLTYTQLTWTDRRLLDNFIAAAKGSYDNTWTLRFPTPGVYYIGVNGLLLSAPPSAGQPAFIAYDAHLNQGQIWQLVQVDATYYKIVSIASQMVLDVRAAGNTAGTEVDIYPDNGLDQQRWKVDFFGGNAYRIYPKVNLTLLLDVNGNRFTSGTPVDIAANAGPAFQSWTLNQAPSFYTNCGFAQDSFQWTQAADGRNLFSTTLQVKQTQPGGQVTPAYSAAVYPSIGPGGSSTMYPFVSSGQYLTLSNQMPTGPQYSLALYGAGLAGFPNDKLHGWTLPYSALTNSALQVLEAFFMACRGRWASFSFTDPETLLAYPAVRFADDTLTVTHVSPNQSNVTVRLAEC